MKKNLPPMLVALLLGLALIGSCALPDDFPYADRSFTYDPLANNSDVSAPPKNLELSPFYKKYTSFYGLPIVSSGNVSDKALQQAWKIADEMIGKNHDYIRNIAGQGIVIAIMGKDEKTTDIPEFSNLDPDDPSIQTRGLAGGEDDPAVAVGEENLLCLPYDPYLSSENVFVHEFAHAIHLFGINKDDASFQGNLDSLYSHAYLNLRAKNNDEVRAEKKYAPNAYAFTNPKEYWAEGVQSYYDVKIGYPRTPSELREVDPKLYDLIEKYMNKNTDANIPLCPSAS